MPKTPDADLETETDETVVPVAKPNGVLVQVTVTKFGGGLVSTGERDEEGEVYAERGHKMLVSKAVAESLEARGLAEMD